MKLKKILAMLIAAMLLLSFGCSKKTAALDAQKADAQKQDTAVQSTTAEQTEPADEPAESAEPAEEPAPADYSFTVTDMAGREITFDKPVKRAVALTAADCEIIFALGAEETLVGRGAYCLYPPEATDIPSVNR